MSTRSPFLGIPKPELGDPYDDRASGFDATSDIDVLAYLDRHLLAILYATAEIKGYMTQSGTNVTFGASTSSRRAVIVSVFTNDADNLAISAGRPTNVNNYDWWYIVSDREATTDSVGYPVYATASNNFFATYTDLDGVYIDLIEAPDSSESTFVNSITISDPAELKGVEPEEYDVFVVRANDTLIVYDRSQGTTDTYTIGSGTTLATNEDGVVAYVGGDGNIYYRSSTDGYAGETNTGRAAVGVTYDPVTRCWIASDSNRYLWFSRNLSDWTQLPNQTLSAWDEVTAIAGIVKRADGTEFTMMDCRTGFNTPSSFGMPIGYFHNNGLTYIEYSSISVAVSREIPDFVGSWASVPTGLF